MASLQQALLMGDSHFEWMGNWAANAGKLPPLTAVHAVNLNPEP